MGQGEVLRMLQHPAIREICLNVQHNIFFLHKSSKLKRLYLIQEDQ